MKGHETGAEGGGAVHFLFILRAVVSEAEDPYGLQSMIILYRPGCV